MLDLLPGPIHVLDLATLAIGMARGMEIIHGSEFELNGGGLSSAGRRGD